MALLDVRRVQLLAAAVSARVRNVRAQRRLVVLLLVESEPRAAVAAALQSQGVGGIIQRKGK